ncbi:hypothetical protein FisN_17Lh185 [Fistulifera solaris]|uniref:Uncharacterized protein n=1 Tax=Fistulifera solaris TaxID=1519565 RepID=A0A1Z5JD35_FISSO|nr:hypothetical protein FisN_17Lh185 [Fistulifera solaris]|eukprot:GAX11907.1 hypothetical protein FisN_17Lh185 [Fistulifera solaris]
MNNINATSKGAAAAKNVTTAKRFQTILVARSNTTRPSELEIQLRDYCEKMRVHTRLSGAHIILPCGTSLAIRAYYLHDLECIKEDDLDGLPDFLEHFQTIVVFFVMPFATQQEAMADCSSFVRRALDLLDTWHDSKNEQNKNPPRMMMVNDTHDAVFYLMQMVDAMRPEKTKLRQEYYHRKQKQHLCLLPQLPEPNVLSDHIGNAVMEWAKLLDVSPDDIRLIFISVKSIRALATMDHDTMANIPVDKSVLLRLQSFFGGTPMNETHFAGVSFDKNSQSIFEQHQGSAMENQEFPADAVSPHNPAAYAVSTQQRDYTTAMQPSKITGNDSISMAFHPPSQTSTSHRYERPAYQRPPHQTPYPRSRYLQPNADKMQQSPFQVNVPLCGHPPVHYSFPPPTPWLAPREFAYRDVTTPQPQYPNEHYYHPSGPFQTPSQQLPRHSSAPWGMSVPSRRVARSIPQHGYGSPQVRYGPH